MYDTSDPDWTLVGVNSDFGFAPANYIEIVQDTGYTAAAPVPPPVPEEPPAPSLPQRPQSSFEEEAPRAGPPADAVNNPAAAAIADIIHKQHASAVEPEAPRAPPRPEPAYEPDDEPAPALPRRPPSELVTPTQPPRPRFADLRDEDGETHVQESPPYPRVGDVPQPRSPAGYHMYSVNEMVEVMGKRKKMPTTIGINVATGTIFISPEDEDRQQEWTAEKLSHYSMEGKHVFLDLVRPSKSLDLHAGAKDTAREIVSAIGEICGAYRAEGLREVIAAGSGGGKKKGQILYDFMAQGDDEVTVAVGDEVIIEDDTKSEEWWMVRRLRNGKEGVVPSSYIEITGVTAPPLTGVDMNMSSVERNRLEDIRLTKEASRKSKGDSMDAPSSEVGTTLNPERLASSMTKDGGNQHPQRQKRESKTGSKPSKFPFSSARIVILTDSKSPTRTRRDTGPIERNRSLWKRNSLASKMEKFTYIR